MSVIEDIVDGKDNRFAPHFKYGTKTGIDQHKGQAPPLGMQKISTAKQRLSHPGQWIVPGQVAADFQPLMVYIRKGVVLF